MHHQAFKNYVAKYHELRLGEILSLAPTPNDGIDLIGAELSVEVKVKKRDNPTWPIHEYQIRKFLRESNGKPLYWALVLYDLKTPVEDIPRIPFEMVVLRPHIIIDSIRPHIARPEVWFFYWDWIRQFKVWKPKTGPYRYVHSWELPPESRFRTVRKDGYILHYPRNSGLEQQIQNPAPPPDVTPARLLISKPLNKLEALVHP